MERAEILPKEEESIKVARAGVVGILISRQETTNTKPIFFVTLVVASGLMLLSWSFGGTSFLFGSCGLLPFSKFVILVGHFANVCEIEKKCQLLYASAQFRLAPLKEKVRYLRVWFF